MSAELPKEVSLNRRLIGALLIMLPIDIWSLSFVYTITLDSLQRVMNFEYDPFVRGSLYYVLGSSIFVFLAAVLGLVFLYRGRVPQVVNATGSGLGEKSRKLEKYRRWNWAAFWSPVSWGLFHREYIGILGLVPIVRYVASVYLALQGYRIAWENVQWNSEKDYLSYQRAWGGLVSIWVIAVTTVSFLMGLSMSNQRVVNVYAEKLASPSMTSLIDPFQISTSTILTPALRQYASPDGSFNLKFPGRPNIDFSITNTENGYQRRQVFFSDDARMFSLYGVTISDPNYEVYDITYSDENRLTMFLDSYFSDEDAEVQTIFLTREVTEHYGYPAMDYTVQYDGVPVTGRAILWGAWVYVLAMNDPINDTNREIYQEFLKGFRLFPLYTMKQLMNSATDN